MPPQLRLSGLLPGGGWQLFCMKQCQTYGSCIWCSQMWQECSPRNTDDIPSSSSFPFYVSQFTPHIICELEATPESRGCAYFWAKSCISLQDLKKNTVLIAWKIIESFQTVVQFIVLVGPKRTSASPPVDYANMNKYVDTYSYFLSSVI